MIILFAYLKWIKREAYHNHINHNLVIFFSYIFLLQSHLQCIIRDVALLAKRCTFIENIVLVEGCSLQLSDLQFTTNLNVSVVQVEFHIAMLSLVLVLAPSTWMMLLVLQVLVSYWSALADQF